jgi:predicted transcriptional regulator
MIPDLLNHPEPSALVDTVSPEQVLLALRKLEATDAWPEWTLKLLDYLSVVWSAEAVARPADREGVAELQTLINYALERTANAARLPDSWRQRWQAINDVLESRRMELAGRNPALVLGRKHVDTLLEMLAGGEKGQTYLTAGLKMRGIEISAGRLSQLISLLEGHGLLERRRVGRENQIKLTEEGTRNVPALEPVPVMVAATAQRHGFVGILSGSYPDLKAA